MKSMLLVGLVLSFFIGCGGTATQTATQEDDNQSSFSLKDDNQTKGYAPSKEALSYPHILPADKNNWCQVVKNAPQKSTILLKDGNYTDYCAIRNKSYITIKAEHKYGVTYTGRGFFLTLEDKNHHINLLGVEAKTPTDVINSGLFKAHGYGTFDNHHIYVRDCWIHDSASGILTGPRNHDITVDHCLIHDIKMGYAWYALGWHLALLNSVIYHLENNGMEIRGHYPTNRFWDYEAAETAEIADVTKEKGLENIPAYAWTHLVRGNFFGEGYGRQAARRWDRGSAIAFYMGRGYNDSDDSYLPPQNVLIEENTFYNITPSIDPEGTLYAGAITVDAEAGFSSARKDAIEGLIMGTVVRDNISNVKIFKSFWNQPDWSLITQKNNTSLDQSILKRRFAERIEALKKEPYTL